MNTINLSKSISIGLLLIVLLNHLSFGQDMNKYSELIRDAWKLYEAKEYNKSAEKYTQAFSSIGNKGLIDDRYNAACAWALANKPDSSFIHLFKVANANYSNLQHISSDADLKSLHGDKRWDELINIIKSNSAKTGAKLNKNLMAILDTVFKNDQQSRVEMNSAIQKFGPKSNEVEYLKKSIAKKDSINVSKVQSILDQYGWLGADVVGFQGNMTLFLVIQHASIEIQEKYLPMIRDAVKNGRAMANSLAMLEDRILIRKGEKQIYGSQLIEDPKAAGKYIVAPLMDPENVDRRRAEVGLGPISEYISRWSLTWDVEAYKKKIT